MLTDLRFVVRQLRHSPGFATVVVLTLAIGIGANTAIFSLLNAYLLRPLPYPDSERITRINLRPSNGFAPGSGGIYLDFLDNATQFASLSAAHSVSLNLTGIEKPARLNGLTVSASYLTTLGLPVALGQDFGPEDEQTSTNPRLALLSDEVWRAHFDADPSVVGSIVLLDNQPYEVRGVLRRDTFMNAGVDFLTLDVIRGDAHRSHRRYNHVVTLTARLAPGATIAAARSELQAIKDGLNEQYPDMMKPWGVSVRTLQEANFGGARRVTLSLLAAVGMVLLVACANVANLLLARAAARQGEIAIRAALGATSWQLFRQLLFESLVLAGFGGALGLALGFLAFKPLAWLVDLERLPNTVLAIDARVLLFTVGVSLLTGLVFGTLPAFKAAYSSGAAAMRDSTRSATSARGTRLQTMLIVAELALTVALLVVTGLLLRSFANALDADPGFRPENVLTFELARSPSKVTNQEGYVRFTDEVLARVERIPGVESAAMVSSTPMNGNEYFGSAFWRDDQPEAANTYFTGFDSVGGNVFKTLGIPLLSGRVFDARDQLLDSTKTIIISEQVATDAFPGTDPLGKIVHHEDQVWEVVGVVGDINRFGLDSGRSTMVYKPQVRWPWRSAYVVRTRLPPLDLAREVETAILEIDPEQPIDRVRSLEDTVRQSLGPRSAMASLIMLFGGIAVFLAAIGVYALTCYTVERRYREFGIRLAMGAEPNSIVSMILGRGMLLAALGATLGTGASLALGRLVSFALYDVRWFDATVTLAAVATVFAVTALACWRPARAASRVNPIEALRAD